MSTVTCDAGLTMAMDDYRGLSAYEIAVKNGFEGSEAEWLLSLHGEDGKTHSVNGVEQSEGNITLTGADLPLSPTDARTIPEAFQGVETLLQALNVTGEAVDLGGRYLDNALFR